MTDSYHSESAAEHRRHGPECVSCAIITVSDTRTLDNDKSGLAIFELLQSKGHSVLERLVVPDEPAQIEEHVCRLVQADGVDIVLITGGTGIAPRDRTPEVVGKLLTKELPGYGELLRSLSHQEIGPAAMLSRASGGLIDKTVVLTMPGSPAAVQLAMEKLILPEMGHMVSLAEG